MGHPKISIVTACYNSRSTIEETILSVVNQAYDNLEYIIIDGGSTDGTMDIVDKYIDKIDIVVSEPDHGISDAFNKGIERATGEIIGLVNSDDLMAKGALKVLAANYLPEIDVYRGDMIIGNVDRSRQYVSHPTMKFPIDKRIREVCHQSTFVKKEAYQKWGTYRVGFRYMMDADLLYRFYASGAKFYYINEILAYYQLGGRTSDSWSNKLGEFRTMLLLNGCPQFQSLYRTCKFAFYNIAKNIITVVLGDSFLKKIRYSSYNPQSRDL